MLISAMYLSPPRRRLSENEFIVIPGLTRNPELIVITGSRIKCGMTFVAIGAKIDSLAGGNPVKFQRHGPPPARG